MPYDLDYINRRENYLHNRVLKCDDLKVLYPETPPRKLPFYEYSYHQKQMVEIAKRFNTKLEFFLDVKLGMCRIFATNWHGFRYHLVDGTPPFNSQDVRALAVLFKELGKMAKGFKERVRKQQEEEKFLDDKDQEEALYKCMTDRRIFQRASRAMYGGGKSNLPVGKGFSSADKEDVTKKESSDAHVYSPYPY